VHLKICECISSVINSHIFICACWFVLIMNHLHGYELFKIEVWHIYHIFDNECDGRSDRKSSSSDEASNPVYLHPKKNRVGICFALTVVTL